MLADRPPSAASAAEVIEQSRHESGRTRGGREILVPPKPGADTMLVLDGRGGSTGENEGQVSLTGLAIDVVFPVLHGPYGEDGTVQGLLDLANVPYVGCGVLASAVGMDKLMMKTVFAGRGLRVPDWVGVERQDWVEDPAGITRQIERDLTYPLFVKPANLGSSLGISKVAGRGTLAAAIDEAARFDRRIVVERAVPDAREIECAVLGNLRPEASVAGEIIPSKEFYDYEAKYIDGMSRLEIPAQLDAGMADRVRQLALDAFRAIDGIRPRARRLPAEPEHGRVVPERDQHDARVHDDQHVLEAVGGERSGLSDARRSTHHTGDRTSSRSTELKVCA